MTQNLNPDRSAAEVMQSAGEQRVNLDHFLSIPWCAGHLQGPRIRVIDPPYNRNTTKFEANAFWSETVNTPRTLPFWLPFYSQPDDPKSLVDDFRAFVTIEGGMTGYPGVIHGGMAMAMLDELLGVMIQTNRRLGILPKPGSMTAYLNSSFLAPVRVPGTVMIVGKIVKLDGRKLYTEGWIEDENGKMLTKAEAMFIQLKGKL